jgi:hypothetical protein
LASTKAGAVRLMRETIARELDAAAD